MLVERFHIFITYLGWINFSIHYWDATLCFSAQALIARSNNCTCKNNYRIRTKQYTH